MICEYDEPLYHNGRDFRVKVYRDESHGAPWKEEDGHGPVSEWRHERFAFRPKKAPGERVLVYDKGSFRVYDMQAATKLAWKDGWGMGEKEIEALSLKLKRPATRGDIVHAAVERDFQYLRGWCNDEWFYVGVEVTDELTEREESLWGVESEGHYWREVAVELADEIAPLADREEAANLDMCTD